MATSAFYLVKTQKERRHQVKVQNHITKPQVRLFDTTDELNQRQYEMDSYSASISDEYYADYTSDCDGEERYIWYASDDLVCGDMDIIHGF